MLSYRTNLWLYPLFPAWLYCICSLHPEPLLCSLYIARRTLSMSNRLLWFGTEKRVRSGYLFRAMQPRRYSSSRLNCQWWLKLRPSAGMTSWFSLPTRLVSLEYARPCPEPMDVRASSWAITGIIHMTLSDWRSQLMPDGHGRSAHFQWFLISPLRNANGNKPEDSIKSIVQS